MYDVPADFPISAIAPNRAERDWLHTWCLKNGPKLAYVLELGAGVSTFVIWSALKPITYIAVEPYEPCAETVRKWVPAVEIVDSLGDLKEYAGGYNMLFVDSSCDLGQGYHRTEAIQAVLPFLAEECVIIVHDFNRPASAGPRAWLPKNHWKLVESTDHRNGWGCYMRA